MTYTARTTSHQLLTGSLIGLLILLTAEVTPHFSAQTVRSDERHATYAQLPLSFEPNQGQTNENVQFLVHHGQATTYFTGTETVTAINGRQVTMRLESAQAPQFAGTNELPGKANYLRGNDPAQWHTNLPTYQAINAENVYPGIGLTFYGNGSNLEHDFIVGPGVDPSQIAFGFSGQDELSLDADGNLVLTAGDTTLRMQAPISYQPQENGERTSVQSSFSIEDTTVRIALGEYDPAQTLVIDPTLVYSTYLGGSGNEFGRKIAIDDSTGEAYIGGQTTSSDFPTTSPYQGTYGGNEDAFVTKLNAAGTAVIYSTYVGGSGLDQAIGLTIDDSGNAYIVGNTDSTDFPTASPYQAAMAGPWDVFVTKLNASGSSLVFSTYIGGTLSENGRMIAVDGSENVYVTGLTQSNDYPTASPFQASNTSSPNSDVFVTKFDSSGSSLVYSTYLGGSGSETGDGIMVDSSDNVYVSGWTDSSDFPTSSPFQATLGGDNDAFLAKFDSSGGSLTYSTYLGGAGTDFGRGLTIDNSGNAYVVGITNSTNYPVQSAFQPVVAGGFDAFITKMDASGASLGYSSYLGGSLDDQGLAVSVNINGEAYVAGLTGSSDFPSILPYQATKAAMDDAFVTKLNSSGSTSLYSTFVGGNGTDIIFGIDAASNGNAYITGFTDSTDFPTLTPYQATNGGGIDTLIAQLEEDPFTVTGIADPVLQFTIGATVCDLGQFSPTQAKFCTHTIAAGTNAANGYVISYIPTQTLTSGIDTIDAMATQTTSVTGGEQFGFNLRANTAGGSLTANDFGADPSGGSGTVLAGYEIGDQFKFNTAGDAIAESTTASLLTTYTASFIANIQFATEAGTYATPITYNVVGSY